MRNQEQFLRDFEEFLSVVAEAAPGEFEIREEERGTTTPSSSDGMRGGVDGDYSVKTLWAKGLRIGEVPNFPGRKRTEEERRDGILAEIHRLYEAWVAELRWRFPQAAVPPFPVTLRSQEIWVEWEAETARLTAVVKARKRPPRNLASARLSAALDLAVSQSHGSSIWTPDVQAKVAGLLDKSRELLAQIEKEAQAKASAAKVGERIDREARCPHCGSVLVNRVCAYLTEDGEERPGHEYPAGECDPHKVEDFVLDGVKVGEFWEADRNPVAIHGGDVFLITVAELERGNSPWRWSPPR